MAGRKARKKSEVYPNNDKKQLCKKCMYQGRVSAYSPYGKIREANATVSCDYMGITGHARILKCEDPRECTVYKPKRAERSKTPMRLKKRNR